MGEKGQRQGRRELFYRNSGESFRTYRQSLVWHIGYSLLRIYSVVLYNRVDIRIPVNWCVLIRSSIYPLHLYTLFFLKMSHLLPKTSQIYFEAGLHQSRSFEQDYCWTSRLQTLFFTRTPPLKHNNRRLSAWISVAPSTCYTHTVTGRNFETLPINTVAVKPRRACYDSLRKE